MDNGVDNEPKRRVIKRYSNRKLYDTRDSRYVTLLQIAEMVRNGEDVQIIDNTTKEDKTEVTLALAISEELKTKPRAVPLGSLRTLIQERGEKLLSTLRDGAIGRFIPSPSPGDREQSRPEHVEEKVSEPAEGGAKPATDLKHESRTKLAEIVASSKQTIDQWQHAIDERIRAVIPGISVLMDMQEEVRRLKARVDALEAGESKASRDQGTQSPAAGAPEAEECTHPSSQGSTGAGE